MISSLDLKLVWSKGSSQADLYENHLASRWISDSPGSLHDFITETLSSPAGIPPQEHAQLVEGFLLFAQHTLLLLLAISFLFEIRKLPVDIGSSSKRQIHLFIAETKVTGVAVRHVRLLSAPSLLP